MRQYIPTLLPTLLPLLQSPLTASVVTPVILKLGKSALDDEQKYLGEHSFMLWLNFILGLSLTSSSILICNYSVFYVPWAWLYLTT